MTASKRRSAADFLPKNEPVTEPVVETAPVAEILAEAKANEAPEPVTEPDVLEPEAVISDAATVAALMAEIAGMRKELGDLRKSQNRIIEETSDLTDDLWFITRPGGKRSHRKALVKTPNGKVQRVMVEDVRTAFIGPFDTEAQVREYLAAKAKKRTDSVIDWAVCDVMLGRDAREVERREEKAFQRAYGDDPEADVNVLERRVRGMFDKAASAEKRAMGLPTGEGRAVGEVQQPRVFIKKGPDGTETLDIRS